MEEETITANVILKELREFREENNKRWEENDKKWERNERRWEENDKRWERNERRWEENQKKWEENEKRWKENQKKWEENDKRWKENQKQWEENNKRWKENQKKWEENDQKLEIISTNQINIENRVNKLEEKRKEDREEDRKEFFRVFECMEKSIVNQFKEMQTRMDIRFNKIEAILLDHEATQKEMLKQLASHETKLNLHNVRIEKLENWKDEFETGSLMPIE